MANTLGSLVVNLGLETAQFTAGLTKADYQAQQFARRMEANFKKVAAFIGTLGIGAAVGKFIHDTVQAASALDDLADSTGSSVEALSKLSNQAKISGKDFDVFQNALLKLAVGMGGADDESLKVKNALQAIGVIAKDPATALNDVALAFDKYADGANKAALARAIFGKEGAAFLPVLKDIAKFQDVAATVTDKQAEEAEKLEQSWRRLRIEATALRDVVLSLTTPLADLIEQWKKAHEVFGGTAIPNLLSIGIREGGGLLASNEEALAQIDKRIEDITNDTGLEARWAKALGVTDYIMGRLKEQREFLRFVRDQETAAQPFVGPPAPDRRNQAPAVAETGLNAASRDAALRDITRDLKNEEDKYKDRQHFLDQYYQDDIISINKYFAERQQTLDLAIERERFAFDQSEKIIRAFKPDTETERIANEEKLRDVIEARNKAEREYINESADAVIERNRAAKDFLRTIEQTAIALQAARGDTVGAGLGAFDLQHRDERAKLITENRSTFALDQLREILETQLKLNKATLEYANTTEAVGIAQTRVDLQQQTSVISEITALNMKADIAKQYIPILRQQIEAQEAIAKALPPGAEQDAAILRIARMRLEVDRLASSSDSLAQKFNDAFGSAFADQLTAIADGTKSVKQGIIDLGRAWVHVINEIAAKELASALFGKGGGASGFGSLLASLFGGTGGSQFTEGSANFVGPIAGAAGGTDYAPGGLMKVGEYGTELVRLPRGAQVISHDRLLAARQARGGGDINVSVSMPAGVSKQTAAQLGAEVARGLAYAGRNT